MEWSIQDLGAAGEFIAAIAVVITLIFLTLQIRQNTAVARTAAMRSTYEQYDRFRTATFDPELAELWIKGLANEHLTEPADNVRFSNLLAMLTYGAQSNWECVRQGIMDAEEWRNSARRLNDAFASPGGAKWWVSAQPFFQAAFVREIEAHRRQRSE